MGPKNPFTERLGLRLPLLQAPMAGVATPELAAAVCRAGGLGGLGCGTLEPAKTAALVRRARDAGAVPLHVNFFLHSEPVRDSEPESAAAAALTPLAEQLGVDQPLRPSVPYRAFDDETLAVVLDSRPEVVSFHFAAPTGPIVDALRDAGILIGASATTPHEAQALEAAGCDFVIAQGSEAGGHRGTFAPPFERALIGTLALVPQVVDSVSLPVVAAGGIGDGRGIAAALVLGAAAVQLGTVFLRCPEAAVEPVQRRRLREARAEDTRVTAAFTGRPARALANRLTDRVEEAGVVADYPVQRSLTAPLQRASADAGVADALPMWAGQAFPLGREESAEEVVRRLATETERALSRFR